MTDTPYLLPNSPLPLNDDELADVLQAWFVGLTGLDGKLVRPWRQPNPPEIPDGTVTTWIVFGIRLKPVAFDSYVFHVNEVAATDDTALVPAHDCLFDVEEMEVSVSITGPNCEQVSSLIVRGTKIAQNLWNLSRLGIKYVSIDTPRPMGEKVNQIELRRVDMGVSLRRAINLRYPVQDLTSASASVSVGGLELSVTANPGE